MQIKNQHYKYEKIKKIKYEIFFICFLLILFLLSKVFGISLLKCVFHEVTGLHCPGCGITRMINSMLKLDFYQAFRYNPFMFVLFPFIIIYGIIKLCELMFDKNILNKKIESIILIIVLILLIIFGILRNIDLFNFLAPTIV